MTHAPLKVVYLLIIPSFRRKKNICNPSKKKVSLSNSLVKISPASNDKFADNRDIKMERTINMNLV